MVNCEHAPISGSSSAESRRASGSTSEVCTISEPVQHCFYNEPYNVYVLVRANLKIFPLTDAFPQLDSLDSGKTAIVSLPCAHQLSICSNSLA